MSLIILFLLYRQFLAAIRTGVSLVVILKPLRIRIGMLQCTPELMLSKRMALGPSKTYFPVRSPLDLNGYIKLNIIQMALSNYTRHRSLPVVIHGLRAWTELH